MPTIMERIKEIEFEMGRTQKNKATNYHLGTLKAKLAKLRTQLIDGPSSGTAKGGDGFDVMKSGDARVAMIGFPSVGKSSLLNTMTNTESLAAGYEFTTLTCIPGVIQYNNANIQLLDLPGIIEGAAKGKGRGRQVISTGRTSDLVLMMLSAEKADVQRRKLTRELDSVGIRLNQKPPNVVLTIKKTGGVKFACQSSLTHLDETMVKRLLQEYKIHNCELVIREDVTVDQFIDVIEGNRKYMPCLYVINKVDTVNLKEVDRFARKPHHLVISVTHKLNLDRLLEKIWDYLNFTRVYTKPRGMRPEFAEPVILRKGCTVEHFCHSVHRDMVKNFKYALVWGQSAKHHPQRVGITHSLRDEDVCQIMTKG